MLGALILAVQLQTASVQGVVLQADDGKPIPNALVELSRTDDAPPQSYAATTAADGAFRIPNVRPGEYRLIARRDGYVQAEFGQRRPGGVASLLMLAGGQTVQGVRLIMTPSGVISGHIYDRDGEPIGAAKVQALKSVYQDGRRTLQVVQSTVTNDLGEYRLFGLAPSLYFVSATPSDGQLPIPFIVTAPGAAPEGDRLNDNLPVYFPGVTAVRSAASIDIRAGSDRSGLDITAPPLPMHHARGSIPAEFGSISVVPLSPTPGTSTFSRGTEKGKFDIPSLVPGTYLLRASAPDAKGQTVIEVGDQDLENVSIAFASDILIPGRLTFDDRPLRDQEPDAERVRFQLVSDPQLPGLAPAVYNPFPNGSFTFGVLPGDYRITSLQFEGHPNAYIKSVRLPGRDVLNEGLHVRGPMDGVIEIVVGTKPGNLNGAVITQNRQPAPNAIVVLMPNAARRRWPDQVKTAVSDSAGRFQFQNIPPGDYTVFAWNDIEPGVWQDPEFLRAYESRGTPVRIEEAGRQTTEVLVLQ